MEELFISIGARWDATPVGDAIRALATGGLHLSEAYQGAMTSTFKPYVVYFALPGAVSNTNTTTMEEVAIQFSIFCPDEDGASTCVQIRDALVALYDDVRLTMGGGFEMTRAIRQTAGQFLKEPEQGYACHIDYVFMYE